MNQQLELDINRPAWHKVDYQSTSAKVQTGEKKELGRETPSKSLFERTTQEMARLADRR